MNKTVWGLGTYQNQAGPGVLIMMGGYNDVLPCLPEDWPCNSNDGHGDDNDDDGDADDDDDSWFLSWKQGRSLLLTWPAC